MNFIHDSYSRNDSCTKYNTNSFVKKILCLLFLISISGYTFAQNNIFNLKVLSIKDSLSVDFATVIINVTDKGKEIQQALVTDINGNVKFATKTPFTITVYKLGFKTVKLKVANNNPIKIYLEQLAVNLDNVTVTTAQINERPIDQSLYKVKVISAKDIQQQSATNLRDILMTQLNMQVNADPVLGSSIALQGLSGPNVKILIDGIPILGRENGSIDLSQINLNNIDHIEIVQGPASTVYGADALGGVINLISKTNTTNPLEVSLNTKYESIGTYNMDAGFNFSKNNSALNIYGGRNFFDGYSTDESKRFLLWKPREQYFGGMGFTQKFKSSQLRYKADYLNETIYDNGAPVINPYSAYAFDYVYQTKRLNNSLFYNYNINEFSKTSANISYQNYERTKTDNYKNLVTLENTPIVDTKGINSTTFNSVNIRADYSNHKFKKLSYLTGIEINYENGVGAKITKKQSIADYATYASLEYAPITNLQIRPAVRFAQNSSYGFKAIPALNLLYVYKINTSFRFSVAQGYRAPSLKELYLDFVDINHNIVGNPDLKPENSVNYQLAVDHVLFFGSKLFKFSPSVFYNDVSNSILLALTDVQNNHYTYLNSGSFINFGYGIEASFQTNALKFDAGLFNIYTYNVLAKTYDADNYLNRLEYRVAATYTNTKLNLSGTIIYKHTGSTKAYAVDAANNLDLLSSDAFSFLDLMVSKKLYKAFTITTGIKNILNVTNVVSSIAGSSPHGNASGEAPVAMGAYFFAALQVNLFKDCFKK